MVRSVYAVAPSPPTVGMVGGGQLARMTHQAAIALGLSLRVLARSPTDSAALVASAVDIGDHRRLADLLGFAERCDVVTFDHEHVPPELLATLVDKGVQLRPAPHALRYAQDKRAMRERLGELGIAVPAWRPIDRFEDVARFAAEHGWPVVAKAARGGYDGRGVWEVSDEPAVAALPGVALLVEERVPLRRELAALVARRPSGEVRAWPVVETVQRDGICVEVVAPAPDAPPAAARLAATIATALDVTGVFAVELFESVDGRLLVNELAMRPHNSGHWTIDGARTSQFEQHLRAVLDWPLGATDATAPVAVMVNVLGGPDPELFGRLPRGLGADPALRVHLYGKAPRPRRKLGHVTALGTNVDDTRARARQGAALLRGEPA